MGMELPPKLMQNQKTITHRLCPPYIGAIHRSQYKGMLTKLTGMPYIQTVIAYKLKVSLSFVHFLLTKNFVV